MEQKLDKIIELLEKLVENTSPIEQHTSGWIDGSGTAGTNFTPNTV